MDLNPVAEEIWGSLLPQLNGNPYGTAALMGNLFAESSLNSWCVTGGGLKTQTQKNNYVRAVCDGSISQEQFKNDGVAFGLAQWRYWSRKEALYLFAKEQNEPICGTQVQINFMLKELKTYRTVWAALTTGNNIREISDIVMERYEKPGNVSEQAKAKREQFAQEYYDEYCLQEKPSSDTCKWVVTTAKNVNLREGNGKEYASTGQAKTEGSAYKWVATADNGWHAVEAIVSHRNRVVWISGDFSRIEIREANE